MTEPETKPKPLTQRDRVLRALRRAGKLGISQGDFLEPTIRDGGAKITRVGARIQELQEEGYRIIVTGKRHRFAVYVLDESTPNLAPASSTPPPDWWTPTGGKKPTNAVLGDD